MESIEGIEGSEPVSVLGFFQVPRLDDPYKGHRMMQLKAISDT
jgi:hypothetical protein